MLAREPKRVPVFEMVRVRRKNDWGGTWLVDESRRWPTRSGNRQGLKNARSTFAMAATPSRRTGCSVDRSSSNDQSVPRRTVSSRRTFRKERGGRRSSRGVQHNCAESARAAALPSKEEDGVRSDESRIGSPRPFTTVTSIWQRLDAGFEKTGDDWLRMGADERRTDRTAAGRAGGNAIAESAAMVCGGHWELCA